MINPALALHFMQTAFGHDALQGHHIGTSAFTPQGGRHTWHSTPAEAAAWAMGHAHNSNVYFRTTLAAHPPKTGRGTAEITTALVGVHADLDIAHEVHTKTGLPPDLDAAERIVQLIGLPATIVVHSGHGLQAHWLFKEPWLLGPEDLEGATHFVKRFGETITAAAESIGFTVDSIADCARLLRLPGSVNRKTDPVPVTILREDGPRYERADVEAIFVDLTLARIDSTPALTATPATPGRPAPATAAVDLTTDAPSGFTGTDDELLDAARRAKNGLLFRALFDRGETTTYNGDASRADWHLVDQLAFWCGPNPARIDALFRRSRLLRPKWDDVHAAGGQTYGAMTIADVLEKRTTYFSPRLNLPTILVNNRHLRDQTAEAIAALHLANVPPALFRRGTNLVRVRLDGVTGAQSIEPIGVDAVVGAMTRSADYLRVTQEDVIRVRPPEVIARDILSRPTWPFPDLVGVVDSPRVRPDGSILMKPGYDPATKLVLAPYPGWEGFDVPEDPTNQDVDAAKALIEELLCDFPFVADADYANAVAYLLTPILRPAIAGAVPVAAFDALSKQGTGKSLLARTCNIIASGREPAMSAMPNDEPEWRKSLTALLMNGRESIVFDNATGAMIESGTWANAITSDVFDDRALGTNRRVDVPIRCTWAITGNALMLGGDMARRTYQVLQDAGVERPEDRTDFRHPLPGWAHERRLDLLRACLILCRRWWADCCPNSRVPRWGSFEAFTEVVGGVLANVGIEGFLANRAAFREAADLDRAEWFGFMSALAVEFAGTLFFTTTDVCEAANRSLEFREALPGSLREAFDRQSGFSRRVGRALAKRTGAVFGTFRLADAGRDSHSKKPRFRVETINAERGTGTAETPIIVNTDAPGTVRAA